MARISPWVVLILLPFLVRMQIRKIERTYLKREGRWAKAVKISMPLLIAITTRGFRF